MASSSQDDTAAVIHRRSLEQLCRLCGNTNRSSDGRKPQDKLLHSKVIQQALSVDVTKDNEDIHPKYVCDPCRRALQSWHGKNKKLKQRDRAPLTSINLKSFVAHNEECSLCSDSQDLQAEQTTEVQKAAIAAGHKLGFGTWKGEDGKQIFATLDLKSLLANRVIVVNKDSTFTLQINGRYIYVDTIPQSLDTANVEKLFELSMQPMCIGIPDFQDLLTEGRTFKNVHGELVATVEHEYHIKYGNSYVNPTIRHSKCESLVASEGRCKVCKIYTVDMRNRQQKPDKQSSRQGSAGQSTSHARHDYMSRDQLIDKVSMLQHEKADLKRNVKVLQERVSGLMESEAVGIDDGQSSDLQRIFEGEDKNICDKFPPDSPIRLLWEQQKQYIKLRDPRQMRWHPAVVKWCIALHGKSPSAYKMIRKSGFLQLPHQTTLSDYTHFAEARSGITPDNIKMLLKEAKLEESPERDQNISIVFDEMKIKSGLVFSQRNGKIVGFTEMGELNDEFAQFERRVKDVEDPPLASYVLVLMVRGIFSSLQQPIAYYPCTGFTGTQLFHVLWEAADVLEFIGFKVRSFVSDGASPNRKFYQLHEDQAQGRVTYCTTNPVNPERYIYFICDVPHLLKTTRNNWENSGWNTKTRKMRFQGKPILWTHLVEVFEDDLGIGRSSPGLRQLHKLTVDHIHLTPSSRMRVYLAAQVLSSNVANALELRLQEKPHLETASTIKFVRYMDTFFDCLNVSNRYQGAQKNKGALVPYENMDDPRFQWLTNDFLGFLDEWQDEGKQIPGLSADDKKRLTLSQQTLDGLRITVYSFVELCQTLLSLEDVKYLLSEKFSQDPLEEYFSKHRGAGGFNEHPTSFMVGHQFNSLLVSGSAALRAVTGNCTNKEREDGAKLLDDTKLDKRKRSTKSL